MLKLNRLAKVCTLSMLLLAIVSSATAANKYQEIDTSGTKAMIDSGKVLVVFPLSPIEFADKHIAGSVNIPMDLLAQKLPKDKNQPIIFYCLGIKCVASWRAAEKAAELGYQNVYAYREGLPAWDKAGYPVVTTEKLPDVKISKISTETLEAMLIKDDMVLVDINLDEDAHKFYIDDPKRIHIPLDELNDKVSLIPKGKKVVVICLKGNRAATAVRYLTGKGYADVVMVDGGLQQWIMDGRPVKKAG